MQIVSRLELSIERAGLNRSCAIQYEGVFYRSDRLLGGAAARLGRIFFSCERPGSIVSCDRCPVAPRASPVPDLCSSVMPDTTDGHSLRFDRVRRLKVTAADICAC